MSTFLFLSKTLKIRVMFRGGDRKMSSVWKPLQLNCICQSLFVCVSLRIVLILLFYTLFYLFLLSEFHIYVYLFRLLLKIFFLLFCSFNFIYFTSMLQKHSSLPLFVKQQQYIVSAFCLCQTSKNAAFWMHDCCGRCICCSFNGPAVRSR